MRERRVRKRRRILITIALFCGVLAVIAAGYQFGFLQTLGYEWKAKSGGGLTSSDTGLSLGVKLMHLSPGTTFFVDYDAVVKAGSLDIHLTSPDGRKFYFPHRVTQTGDGQVTFHIQHRGWYGVAFEGSVLDESGSAGYDVDYTARWGVR